MKHVFLFLLDIYPRVELLSHGIGRFKLNFVRNPRSSSKVIVSAFVFKIKSNTQGTLI